MKEWFIREAEELVYGENQPSLFDAPEDHKADQKNELQGK